MTSSSAVTGGVDLQADAVVLARRLGSRIHFLEAVHDLEACKNASSFYFQRHSRKIITLIEIARKTLLAMGVQPYPFSPCPPLFSPHKTAYIHLLLLLKERLNDVDPALEVRLNSLLFPLYSESRVVSKGGPSSGHFPRVHPPLWAGHTSSTSRCLAGAAYTVGSATPMPPPDSHPPVINITEKHQVHPRRNIYGEDEEVSSRHPCATNYQQENDIFPTRLYKPLRRRFGIFCTPKSSMHTYRQPSIYSRPAPPLKE